MFSMVLAATVQAALFGSPQSSFDRAFQESASTGRPLVVLIGADWCPSCQVMKNTTLPEVARHGGLKGVVFAYVDADQDPKLVARLSRVKAIPQLIRYDRTPDGWQGRLLVGAQTAEDVTAFVAPDATVVTDQGPVAQSRQVGDPQTGAPLAREGY